MFKPKMTYVQQGQKHHRCSAESGIDRKKFVFEMRNRNGTAIRAVPGFILMLSMSRET
jgi:hypothetical protein